MAQDQVIKPPYQSFVLLSCIDAASIFPQVWCPGCRRCRSCITCRTQGEWDTYLYHIITVPSLGVPDPMSNDIKVQAQIAKNIYLRYSKTITTVDKNNNIKCAYYYNKNELTYWREWMKLRYAENTAFWERWLDQLPDQIRGILDIPGQTEVPAENNVQELLAKFLQYGAQADDVVTWLTKYFYKKLNGQITKEKLIEDLDSSLHRMIGEKQFEAIKRDFLSGAPLTDDNSITPSVEDSWKKLPLGTVLREWGPGRKAKRMAVENMETQGKKSKR